MEGTGKFPLERESLATCGDRAYQLGAKKLLVGRFGARQTGLKSWLCQFPAASWASLDLSEPQLPCLLNGPVVPCSWGWQEVCLSSCLNRDWHRPAQGNWYRVPNR